VLDLFSAFSVQKRMAQLAGEEFETSLTQLEDIRFVNVSLDLGTAHWLTLIHCIVSDPFSLASLVLFNLQESLHFPVKNYASLFEIMALKLTRRESTMLTQDPKRVSHVVSALLIDNLRAQSSGLDLFLAPQSTPEHSAIIHVHCLARMINLVIFSRRAGEPFYNDFEDITFCNYYCGNVTRCPSLAKRVPLQLPLVGSTLSTVSSSFCLIAPSQFLFITFTHETHCLEDVLPKNSLTSMHFYFL
jgi:hypothetical protein